MKFENKVILNSNHYDIYQSYIFQSCQLLELLQCIYICPTGILFQLLLNNGQVCKAAFGSEARITSRRLFESRRLKEEMW